MGWRTLCRTLWRTVVGSVVAMIFGVLVDMGLSHVTRDAVYRLLVRVNAVLRATAVPVVGQHNINTNMIALALMGILLKYMVVALEKVFAFWAERSPGWRDLAARQCPWSAASALRACCPNADAPRE